MYLWPYTDPLSCMTLNCDLITSLPSWAICLGVPVISRMTLTGWPMTYLSLSLAQWSLVWPWPMTYLFICTAEWPMTYLSLSLAEWFALTFQWPLVWPWLMTYLSLLYDLSWPIYLFSMTLTNDLYISLLAEWPLSPLLTLFLHQMELRLELRVWGILRVVPEKWCPIYLVYDLFISLLAEWFVPTLLWSLAPVIAVLVHQMELRLELGVRGILRVICPSAPVTSSVTLTYDLFISFVWPMTYLFLSLAEWPVPMFQWPLTPLVSVFLHPMELRLELGIPVPVTLPLRSSDL